MRRDKYTNLPEGGHLGIQLGVFFKFMCGWPCVCMHVHWMHRGAQKSQKGALGP